MMPRFDGVDPLNPQVGDHGLLAGATLAGAIQPRRLVSRAHDVSAGEHHTLSIRGHQPRASESPDPWAADCCPAPPGSMPIAGNAVPHRHRLG